MLNTVDLNTVDKNLLAEIAGLHELPQGAFNIRRNGESISRNTTGNIEIITKENQPGLDVIVKPGTKGESVHIPVILSEDFQDTVYNTFEIGAGSDVLVVAGCGIHNSSGGRAQHDGIHEFFVRKGAKMKYVEKHYGEGSGSGDKILNPRAIITIEEGGIAELEMVQIKGVDHTVRDTKIVLGKDARLVVLEKLLTNAEQTAESNITVELRGDGSSAQIVSRSVAQDKSKQVFHLAMHGYTNCRGHIECDSIIMDQAQVSSIPEVAAYHTDAQLIHEAAIGKIASNQIIKLMTLGLTDKEAEERILQGFLK